jgi:hypothetical protein
MQTHLRLARISPLSVLKFSALASVVVFLVAFAALAGVYMAVDAFGVIERVRDLAASVASSADNPDPLSFLEPSWVLPKLAVVVAGLSLVAIPISVIGALITNLVLRVTGGVEATWRQS